MSNEKIPSRKGKVTPTEKARRARNKAIIPAMKAKKKSLSKIDISKKKKPPGLDKTAWEELKYAADQVSNTLMFAPDTVESIYKGNAQPVVDRFRKISKTKQEYFTPKKAGGRVKNRNMGGVIGGGLGSQDVVDYLYKYKS